MNPAGTRQALRTLGLTRHLNDEQIESVLPFCSIRSVRAGETIFCQNEPSPYCFGVLSGEVSIIRESRQRKGPSKCLGVLGSGEIFGESSLLNDSPRTAMASATRDGEILTILGLRLREWIQAHPVEGIPILLRLLESSLERLRHTSLELTVVSAMSRILGGEQPPEEALPAALAFLQESLNGVNAVALFSRDTETPRFQPLFQAGAPSLAADISVPLTFHGLGEAESHSGATALRGSAAAEWAKVLGLVSAEWLAMVVMPIADPDREVHFPQGFLWAGSRTRPEAFREDVRQTLTSAGYSLREAMARLRRR